MHIGAADVPARLRRLGDEGDLVRLQLHRPLPLQVGDRLLLRDPGRRRVIAGATVLDPAPPPLSRRGAARLRAAELAGHPGTADVGAEVARRGAVPAALLEAIGVVVDEPLPPAVLVRRGWLVERRRWEGWLEGLARCVVDDPQAPALVVDAGVPRDRLIAALALPHPTLLDQLLLEAPDLEEVGGRVRRRGGRPSLRGDLGLAVERLAAALRSSPFAAPDHDDLARLGLGRQQLSAAAAAGVLLRLPGDVVLLPDAPQAAASLLRTLPQPFTVSAARQVLGTSRRVAVPLLEHLDALRVTQRLDGGVRRVR